jgi:hypothetical protein
MAQILILGFTMLLLLAIVGLFLRKAGLQLQYLRIQKKQPPGQISDFIKLKGLSKEESALRWQAFLLFPMLYGVPMEEEQADLMDLKRAVKRTHILIYLALIALVVVGVYAQKVFPAS